MLQVRSCRLFLTMLTLQTTSVSLHLQSRYVKARNMQVCRRTFRLFRVLCSKAVHLGLVLLSTCLPNTCPTMHADSSCAKCLFAAYSHLLRAASPGHGRLASIIEQRGNCVQHLCADYEEAVSTALPITPSFIMYIYIYMNTPAVY